MLKAWNELPDRMRNEAVLPYYQFLAKRRTSMAVKRVLDFTLALLMSVILSPVMLVIAAAIKLDSAGPVFFRQERITRYGKRYRIFKFRTMVQDADKKGPSVTEKSDSRITRVGAKIRKLRLDEIPQLFNILAGDMSFVGTRPEVKKYVDKYQPEMMATLLMPAGITSRCSIEFKDEDELIEEYLAKGGESVDEIYVTHILPQKMKYNLEYIQKFGVLADLKIMIQTVLAVLH